MSHSRLPTVSNPSAQPPGDPAGLVLRLWQKVLQFCESPLNLLVLILLVNSLSMPYRGIKHDARLYAFEVVNQLQDNVLHDELSLCYARAGKFSIFSAMVLPATRMLGVPVSFFLIYLVSKTLFFLGLQRLVCRLVPKRSVAIISLLLIAATSVGFGGMRVFNVNESFLTPRILATGLVLFGLERLLNHRWLQSLGLMGIALTVHPVMAISGVLVWAVSFGFRVLTIRQQLFAYGIATVAAIVTLAIPSIGLRIFGEMDPTWKDCVDDFNLYAVPQLWDATDWLQIVIAFSVCGAGLGYARLKNQAQPTLVALLVVSAVGILGSLICNLTPYALLFQGQSYRALWLVQLIQIPVGLLLAHRLWSRNSLLCQLTGFGLVAYYLSESQIPTASLCFFAALLLSLRLLELDKNTSRRIAATAAIGCLATLSLLQLPPTILGGLQFLPSVAEDMDTMFWWYFAARALGVLFSLLIVTTLATTVSRFARHRSWQIVGGLALIISLVAFWVPYSPIRESLGAGEFRTTAMIGDYLDANADVASSHPAPTVYWSRGASGNIWHDLHARSYLCVEQLAGTMFLRDSALEGRRRAQLVAPFDVSAFRIADIPGPSWETRVIEQVYGQSTTDPAPPTREDLVRLLNEPIDLIVLRHNIDDLYDCSNGRAYLYDTRKLKAKLKQEQLAGI